LAVGAVAAVAVAGGVVAGVHAGSSGSTAASDTSAPPPATQIVLVGLRNGHVPWNKPVRIQVVNGTLRSVSVVEGETAVVDGVLADGDTQWTSAETLVPLSHYQATIDYVDSAHHTKHQVLGFTAADASKHLKVTLSPGDGNTVGVGSPVIASFSRPVPHDQRATVEARLSVTTSPQVVGAWHWMSDQEVHWRPPTYWHRGTRVSVSADLTGLYLGKGVWGAGKHESSFKIGDSHISRVDVAAHEMYVYDNGRLIRTMPISAGRDKYPTKNGVHITFEKSQVVTMDSATVGIPRNSPDGYYEKVYWDVRISYGGAFVHAAPWSVGDQGRVNVSHGCVNLSTANAIWFYNFAMRGDIVDVYNSSAAPDYADPGMADWNMSWAQWVAGDAAPSSQALAKHARMPRDYEPGAPSYSSSSGSSTGASQGSSSSSPTPTRSTSSPTPTRSSASPSPSRH
jgi:lipoprotein-anchoring transpeptidase ErfK/SrfK